MSQRVSSSAKFRFEVTQASSPRFRLSFSQLSLLLIVLRVMVNLSAATHYNFSVISRNDDTLASTLPVVATSVPLARLVGQKLQQ